MKRYWEYDLWSDEYFQELLNDKIKADIAMMIYARHKRHPTKEEYEEWFKKFVDGAKCVVRPSDIGELC